VLKGIVFQLIASLGFALATIFAKSAHQHAAVSALEVAFFRFLVGFLLVGAYVLVKRKPLRPVRPGLIGLRSVFNYASVILLYLGIQYSTVTTANLLNMTYPVYVFLLAPHINRERAGVLQFLLLGLTMVGIYLVVFPGGKAFAGFNPADTFALASGIVGGFAVSLLRESGKHDPSHVILFYLMLIGVVLGGAVVAPVFVLPPGGLLLLLVASGLSGLVAQVFNTISFRYIDAQTGALVSTSRILFAAALGVLLFSDRLTPRILAGGLLIVVSVVGSSGALRTLVLARLRAGRSDRPAGR